MEFQDLQQFLTWIIAGGGALAISGWITSRFLERREWWQKLSSTAKELITYAIPVALSLLAYGITLLPVEYYDAIAKVFALILSSGIFYAASQASHDSNPARKK